MPASAVHKKARAKGRALTDSYDLALVIYRVRLTPRIPSQDAQIPQRAVAPSESVPRVGIAARNRGAQADDLARAVDSRRDGCHAAERTQVGDHVLLSKCRAREQQTDTHEQQPESFEWHGASFQRGNPRARAVHERSVPNRNDSRTITSLSPATIRGDQPKDEPERPVARQGHRRPEGPGAP